MYENDKHFNIDIYNVKINNLNDIKDNIQAITQYSMIYKIKNVTSYTIHLKCIVQCIDHKVPFRCLGDTNYCEL